MLTNLRNIGFIFLYISIWLSLDSSIYNVINLQNANFFEIIISFRFVVPYIIVALLVILFIKDFLLIKLNGNFKYLIYLLFFVY